MASAYVSEVSDLGLSRQGQQNCSLVSVGLHRLFSGASTSSGDQCQLWGGAFARFGICHSVCYILILVYKRACLLTLAVSGVKKDLLDRGGFLIPEAFFWEFVLELPNLCRHPS